eukprot:366462-Chlamydomonas_euryale.AAC.8
MGAGVVAARSAACCIDACVHGGRRVGSPGSAACCIHACAHGSRRVGSGECCLLHAVAVLVEACALPACCCSMHDALFVSQPAAVSTQLHAHKLATAGAAATMLRGCEGVAWLQDHPLTPKPV